MCIRDRSGNTRKWFDLSAWKTAVSNPAMAYLLLGFFVCIFSFANFETTLSMLIKGSKSFEDAPFDFSFKQVCLTFAMIGFMVAVVQGGGLGGCPYAPGASGNVATERVLDTLIDLKYEVELDRDMVCQTAQFAKSLVERP